MILNKKEISQKLFEEKDCRKKLGVTPTPNKKLFDEESGASIDLHLGRWFRIMKQSHVNVINIKRDKKDTPPTKEYFIPFHRSFILHPGKFVLGITLEWLNIPGDIAGHVTGKSSLGRRGLIIETAAGIQPGFAGGLTLEFANVGEIPIELQPGIAICQIFLHNTTSFDASAASQFKGSRKPGL